MPERRNHCAHARSHGPGEFIYDPLHYLALLEQKPRALDQAAPLQDWVLPEAFDRLRRVLEARMERRGRKEYIQVFRFFGGYVCMQLEEPMDLYKEVLTQIKGEAPA